MRDGRQAFFLFLPEGEDPDTLVRKEGTGGFEARLNQATPLLEYFYTELSRDTNTATLDGRAKLAEHAKPLLAKLPEGAFRDLMLAELERRTGVHKETVFSAPISGQRSVGRPDLTTGSLVSKTVAMLLADPKLAQEIEPPYSFANLQTPGISLLTELLDVARARPGVSTVLLLEHFSERSESKALQKLALVEFPGEPEALRAMFLDAARKLAAQTPQQRLNALISKQRLTPLDEDEKNELRDLLARKGRPSSTSGT
jgi:DNA primase